MSAAQSAVEEVQSAETPAEAAPAQRALRARSVPTALPLSPVTPPREHGESPIPPEVRKALARLLGAFTIPAGTDVLKASGLHAAHLRHKEAAAHWEAAAVRVPRRLWGWLHLLLKACLGLLDWVTESPARFLVAVIVTVASVKWL